MKIFERYQSIIPAWDDFIEASRTPLATCIWANPLRTDAACLKQELQKNDIDPNPVKWHPGAFRLPPEFNPGTRIEYWAGLYHVQEEVAMLPALILAPKPGDVVLDLCAAPGNKTAQMAVMMHNRGTLVANEINGHRMQPLRQVINRLGLTNVTTSVANANAYPKQPVLFDCIMADVVCSCEGTSRKNRDILKLENHAQSFRLQGTQVAILKRALQLCKPGGQVIYATCTYAPEENELVVQKALEALAEKIPASILSCKMPGFNWSPGLESWQGQRFRKDIVNTCRIYPHQNDTGGFFFALIQKEDDLRRQPVLQASETAANQKMKELEVGPILDCLEKRFGLARGLFDDYNIFRTNKKIASLVRKQHFQLTKPIPETIGLPFVHIKMNQPKLTTAAAMSFGKYATKHVLELARGQIEDYFSGKQFNASRDQISDYQGQGLIIVKCQDMFLGTAFFRDDGTVESRYPKSWFKGKEQSGLNLA